MSSIFNTLRRRSRASRKKAESAFPGIDLHIVDTTEEGPFPGVRLHVKKVEGKAEKVNGNITPQSHKMSVVGGFDSVQGPVRPSMEDTVSCIDDLRTEIDLLKERTDPIGWYGVFDGHSGAQAAQLIQNHLHRVVATNSHFLESNTEQSFISGFLEMDQMVLRVGEEEGWGCGSTVSVAIVEGNILYTANLGDGLIVLAQRQDENGDNCTASGPTLRAVNLAEVHKATEPAEKERIVKAGGMVMRGRVYGDLAISRALGDKQYKRPIADADFVSAVPATRRVVLHADKHDFLIISSDGLWDKVSIDEAVNIVAEMRVSDPGKSPMEISKALTDIAIERKSGDNVSVIVILFNWEPVS